MSTTMEQQLQNTRTLQESYNDLTEALDGTLAPLADAYNTDRAALIAAVNSKFDTELQQTASLSDITDLIGSLGQGIDLNAFINGLE